MRRTLIILLPLVGLLAGCPIFQPQSTPVPAFTMKDPASGQNCWLYVPSYYKADRQWPLVITLHGTFGFDNAEDQIKEWKYLAEERGLIVAAPPMRCVQGILPVVKELWFADMEKDDAQILSLLEMVAGKYNIDRKAVLLTGFSAGGYPMWNTGLRHPTLFSMLIGRSANSSLDLFERLELSDEAKKLPITLFWGKNDVSEIARQGWQAYEWLKNHHCAAIHKETKGGHLRNPEPAYEMWKPKLPKQYWQ